MTNQILPLQWVIWRPFTTQHHCNVGNSHMTTVTWLQSHDYSHMTTDIMQPTEEGLKVVHLPMGEPLTAHEGAKINRIHSKQEPLQDGSFYFCFEPSKLILHKQKGHFSLFPGEVPNMGKYQIWGSTSTVSVEVYKVSFRRNPIPYSPPSPQFVS